MRGIQVEFDTRAEAQAALPHLRAMIRAATEAIEPVHYDDGFIGPCGSDMKGWLAQAYVVTKAEHPRSLSRHAITGHAHRRAGR